MLLKSPPIINKKLLVVPKNSTCHCCGGRYELAKHHHVRRKLQRLDVDENLSILCGGEFGCHTKLHWFKEAFIRAFGKDRYEYYTNLKELTLDEIYAKYEVDRL